MGITRLGTFCRKHGLPGVEATCYALALWKAGDDLQHAVSQAQIAGESGLARRSITRTFKRFLAGGLLQASTNGAQQPPHRRGRPCRGYGFPRFADLADRIAAYRQSDTRKKEAADSASRIRKWEAKKAADNAAPAPHLIPADNAAPAPPDNAAHRRQNNAAPAPHELTKRRNRQQPHTPTAECVSVARDEPAAAERTETTETAEAVVRGAWRTATKDPGARLTKRMREAIREVEAKRLVEAIGKAERRWKRTNNGKPFTWGWVETQLGGVREAQEGRRPEYQFKDPDKIDESPAQGRRPDKRPADPPAHRAGRSDRTPEQAQALADATKRQGYKRHLAKVQEVWRDGILEEQARLAERIATGELTEAQAVKQAKSRQANLAAVGT